MKKAQSTQKNHAEYDAKVAGCIVAKMRAQSMCKVEGDYGGFVGSDPPKMDDRDPRVTCWIRSSQKPP